MSHRIQGHFSGNTQYLAHHPHSYSPSFCREGRTIPKKSHLQTIGSCCIRHPDSENYPSTHINRLQSLLMYLLLELSGSIRHTHGCDGGPRRSPLLDRVELRDDWRKKCGTEILRKHYRTGRRGAHRQTGAWKSLTWALDR